jgi:hypothetical protein
VRGGEGKGESPAYSESDIHQTCGQIHSRAVMKSNPTLASIAQPRSRSWTPTRVRDWWTEAKAAAGAWRTMDERGARGDTWWG